MCQLKHYFDFRLHVKRGSQAPKPCLKGSRRRQRGDSRDMATIVAAQLVGQSVSKSGCELDQTSWNSGIACSGFRLVPWPVQLGAHLFAFEGDKLRPHNRISDPSTEHWLRTPCYSRHRLFEAREVPTKEY